MYRVNKRTSLSYTCCLQTLALFSLSNLVRMLDVSSFHLKRLCNELISHLRFHYITLHSEVQTTEPNPCNKNLVQS
jgi:hypothetical protein